MSDTQSEWPLFEVFLRPKAGLDHKHCGSLHASDATMALQMARDVYTNFSMALSTQVLVAVAWQVPLTNCFCIE